MSQIYKILVAEEVDTRWAAWFGGLEIIHLARPAPAVTLLRGELPDQAALYGVLNRLRDLNLTLIEVRREDDPGYTPDIHPQVE